MQAHRNDQIEAQISGWIKEMSTFEGQIKPEDNFIKTGWLDSFAVLGLIMQIEQHYGFKFEMEELANPDLQIIQNLAQVISSKIRKTSI